MLICASYWKRRECRLANIQQPAAESSASHQFFSKQDVSCRPVFDVEVIAYVLAIGADDRTLSPHDRANRAGHNAIPVEVATAIKISAACDGDRQGKRRRIRLRDQIGAG